MALRRQIKTGAVILMFAGNMLLFSGCKNTASDTGQKVSVKTATGSTLTKDSLRKEEKAPLFDIREHGAKDHGDPVTNTAALNHAIEEAHKADGGTVTVPEGASFDAETHQFVFTPANPGRYNVTFTLDDGVLPVRRTVTFTAE